MNRTRSTILISGMLAAFSFIGGLVANIATGTLPDAITAHGWVFWVLTGIFMLIVVWLTVAAAQVEATENTKDTDTCPCCPNWYAPPSG